MMTEEQAEEIIRQRDERRREELYNSIVNLEYKKATKERDTAAKKQFYDVAVISITEGVSMQEAAALYLARLKG